MTTQKAAAAAAKGPHTKAAFSSLEALRWVTACGTAVSCGCRIWKEKNLEEREKKKKLQQMTNVCTASSTTTATATTTAANNK